METTADDSAADSISVVMGGPAEEIQASEAIVAGSNGIEALQGSPPQLSKPELKTVTPKASIKPLSGRDSEQDWAVYPESNYSFEADSTLENKWGSGDAAALFAKRQEAYLREGTRRSVAAIFLVHRAEFPHVLFLLDKQQQKYSLVMFKYKTWQRPREVLHDKLLKRLVKPDQGSKRKWVSQQLTNEGSELDIGEYLGEWWRGEFDDELIPYLPPHVTRPKERVRVHQVQLPPRCSFRVPPGFCLTAVPIFDLSPQRVGIALSGLSHLLARFSIRLMLPTSDKYEAANSLGHEAESAGNVAEPGADTGSPTEKPEIACGQGDTELCDGMDDLVETLPPELQHLAELEETT